MSADDPLLRDALQLRDDAQIHDILEQLCALTGMGFAAVARVTETRWIACQVIDQIDFGLDAGAELDIKMTICDDIRESGEAVIIDQVSIDPVWRTHPVPILYGFESYVSVPLTLDDGQFFGTMCAIDPKPRSISAPDLVAQFETLAARVVAVLSRRGDGPA